LVITVPAGPWLLTSTGPSPGSVLVMTTVIAWVAGANDDFDELLPHAAAAVKNGAPNADVSVDDRTRWGTVSTHKRLSSYDIALIGIVLVACGIAALASASRLGDGLLFAGAPWALAVATFIAARRPSRR
jgi:hypothetical protein